MQPIEALPINGRTLSAGASSLGFSQKQRHSAEMVHSPQRYYESSLFIHNFFLGCSPDLFSLKFDKGYFIYLFVIYLFLIEII